jgi:histidinol-phosphatase
MTDADNLMDFASRLAASAGRITLEHFGRVDVQLKGDGSEVTAADLAAEAHIREAITSAFPGDGILGEEGDDVPSTNGRRWVVDPIDGTRSFASGVPLYAVLLALEVDGRTVMGCCHLPALGHTLVAAEGAGAWADGAPARVSECDDLAQARLLTSGFEYWRDRSNETDRAGWDRLTRATRFARTWGDGYGYFLVATGRMDLLADPIAGSHWDFAPMIPILTEAGGRFTKFDGTAVESWGPALASNGRLHEQAQAVLSGRSRRA